MWKDEIIKCLMHQTYKYDCNDFIKHRFIMLSIVKDSECIHIGKVSDLFESTKSLDGEESNVGEIEIPYNNILISGFDHNNDKFCIHINRSNDNSVTLLSLFIYTVGKWVLLPMSYTFISKNGFFKNIYINYNKKEAEQLLDLSSHIVSALSFILRCKNVCTETIAPPEKVNKKRLLNSKTPLYSYKVLRVLVPKNIKKTNNNISENGTTMRMHLCRGHFKEYTNENKLFGKHTGLYWWQPTLRGNKDVGSIEKEYCLEY